MTEVQQLSAQQLAIMRVVWSRGEATASDVHEALEADRDLAPTTVATMIARLEKRGLLTHRTEGRQFVYSATIREEDACHSMVSDLTERLFAGDAAALLSHLIAEHEIAPDELDRLRKLIDARRREAKGKE